jgi:hypothetical protein
MTSQETKSASLQDALDELSLETETPRPEMLERLVNRFPEHAAKLTDFAVALALEPDAWGFAEDPAPEATRELVSKAMSHYQNRLYDLEHGRPRSGAAASDIHDPFAKLDKNGFRSLVTRLNVSNIFLMKLRDRQIQPDTITPGGRRRLAAEIGTTSEQLVAYLSGGPVVHGGARFKSDIKPAAAEKQTFKEAVATSNLTDEQQRELLNW